MIDLALLLRSGLAMALAHIAEVSDRPIEPEPVLTIHDDPAFWASVSLGEGGGMVIDASTGVAAAIIAAWDAVLAAGFGGADQSEPEARQSRIVTYATVSLAWLMMHEIEHGELGHFTLTGEDRIGEAVADGFGLVARQSAIASSPVSPHRSIDAALRDLDATRIGPCLELQADHDAIDRLLESYSPHGWDELRSRIACIALVMIVIEQADQARGDRHSSHPKAATRIFQLLGSVVDLPVATARIRAEHEGKSFPDADAVFASASEGEAYQRDVVDAAIGDFTLMAKAMGARHVADAIGDRAILLGDVGHAMTGRYDQLISDGAKQWADLVETNGVLLNALGWSRRP